MNPTDARIQDQLILICGPRGETRDSMGMDNDVSRPPLDSPIWRKSGLSGLVT
jgi:hypothetical protein